MLKHKNAIYILGLVTAAVWGLIIYSVLQGMKGNVDVPMTAPTVKQEAYNDYAVPRDTTKLLLNYRDPFGLVKAKDTTVIIPVKHLAHPIAPVKSGINWSFIRYSGYIHNPVSKKTLTLLSINGRDEMLAEGETKDQVRLIRNLHDSIKVSFNGKVKFITLKPSPL
ncbi:hypothetical protein [Mucilaginibacter sp.]|uniref:hypothetical protein n=1 Tax=Mucilaginibacter sp. TaxID=1882438 RepID=UPI003D1114F0